MEKIIEFIKDEELIYSIKNEYNLFNKIMPFVKKVGAKAFENIEFTGKFKCPNLQEVGDEAFERSKFSGEFDCQNLQTIGKYAFYNSVGTGDFNCPNLQTIGEGAFEWSVFTGNFNCPKLQTILDWAFRYSTFEGEFYCPNVQKVGNHALRSSKFEGELSLPLCTEIGESAFSHSRFVKVTIGANAELGECCIGAHSTEFIRDYKANGKLAGTYIWNGGHWVYQNYEIENIINSLTNIKEFIEKEIDEIKQIIIKEKE